MRLALALCLAVLHAAPGRGRARRPLPALDDDGSHERDDTILANRELTELLLPLLNNFESPRHTQRDLLHKKRLVEIMPLPQKSKQRKGPAPLFLLASELPVRTKTKLRRYNPKDSDDFDENIVEFGRSHHKKKKKHHKHKHQRKQHHKNSTSEEDSASEERKYKKKKHKNPSEEHSDADEHKHRKKKQKEHDDSNSSSEEHSDSDEHNKDHKQHDSDSESSSEEISDSDKHVEGDKSVDKKPVEDKNISNETKNDKDKNDDKTPSENKDSIEDKTDDSKNKHDESTLPEVKKQEESSKEKKDSVENKNDVDIDHSVSSKSSTNESVSEDHKTPEVNRYGDIIDFSPDKQAHGMTSHIELADVIVEERTSQSGDSSQQDGETRYRNLSDKDEPDKSLESINEAPQDNELLEAHYRNTIDNYAINYNDDSSNSVDATHIAINEEYENTVLDDDVLTEAMENKDNPDVSSWVNTKETVRFISSSSEEDSKVISNGDYSADNVSLNEEESNSVELAIHDSLSPESGLDDIEPEESQDSDSISSEFAAERKPEFISSNLQPLWDLPVAGQPPPDSVDSFIEVRDDGDGAKHDAVPGQNYGYVYRNANKGDVSESHKTYKLSFRFNK